MSAERIETTVEELIEVVGDRIGQRVQGWHDRADTPTDDLSAAYQHPMRARSTATDRVLTQSRQALSANGGRRRAGCVAIIRRVRALQEAVKEPHMGAHVVTAIDAKVDPGHEWDLLEGFRQLNAGPRPDGTMRSELLRGHEGAWCIQST